MCCFYKVYNGSGGFIQNNRYCNTCHSYKLKKLHSSYFSSPITKWIFSIQCITNVNVKPLKFW